MNVKEFEIPVPWGLISAKVHGDRTNPTVLLIHGIFDNLGSHDLLIPLLTNDYYYISIDLPGHGRSDSFSINPHLLIGLDKFILAIKLVMDYLKKDKYILIGHSYGGFIIILFTLLFPNRVSKMVMLDIIFPYPLSLNYFKQFLRERISFLTKPSKLSNIQIPVSYDKAFNLVQKRRMYGELTSEAAKSLLDRCLIPVRNGKFKFTTDLRVKLYYNTIFGKEFVLDLLKMYPVKCPILFIMADDSTPLEIYMKDFLKILYKYNNHCFVRKVVGTHDVLINKPESVAPIINAFLSYKINEGSKL